VIFAAGDITWGSHEETGGQEDQGARRQANESHTLSHLPSFVAWVGNDCRRHSFALANETILDYM